MIWKKPLAKNEQRPPDAILGRCLAAFVSAGTLDLSLDQLAARVGISRRMLIHYFGGKEAIELRAIARPEDRLRAQFAPEAFPAGERQYQVVAALWERTTAPAARCVLLLVVDVLRRAWNGSARARAFYAGQQRLGVDPLLGYIPDAAIVESVLQVLQGAVLAYLITGMPKQGVAH